MAEEVNFYDDLLDNALESSNNLKGGSPEVRSAESKIYDSMTKLILESDKQSAEREFNDSKIELEKEKMNQEMELEKYKIDKDLELKREIEMERISIEREKLESEKSKDKTEKQTMWAKVGIAGAEMLAGIGTGILYLKANLKYGGMIGKDAKKWFDDLKHIRL